MTRFYFPYGIRFQEGVRIEVFPALELFVKGRRRNTGIHALFHIDSGATTSILPAGDAEVLGIRVADGRQMLVRGIAGATLTGYRHTIDIQIDGLKTTIPVIFIENIPVPRILGREGIFPQFGILFDEQKRRTAFLEAAAERKTIDFVFR